MKNDEGWKCSYLSSIRPRNFYHINMPMPSAAICVPKGGPDTYKYKITIFDICLHNVCSPFPQKRLSGDGSKMTCTSY